MPDPTTLADVRAHIERRIKDAVEFQERDPDVVTCCSWAVWHELTEILALLDRVKEGCGK